MENNIDKLIKIWRNEKFSPELLSFQQDIIENIFFQIKEKVFMNYYYNKN